MSTSIFLVFGESGGKFVGTPKTFRMYCGLRRGTAALVVVIWLVAWLVYSVHLTATRTPPRTAPTRIDRRNMLGDGDGRHDAVSPVWNGEEAGNPATLTFYYNWYGTQAHDGGWFHWNQPVLLQNGHLGPRHHPPHSIGSSFWPQLGLYSSNDQAVLSTQCDMIKAAGIDAIIVSWYPEGTSDQEEETFHSFQNRNIPLILNACAAKGLYVAFHIEPYKGRTPSSVVKDMQYLQSQYGSHSATLYWNGTRGFFSVSLL